MHGMPRTEHPTLQNNKVKNNIILQSLSGADLVIYNAPPVTGGNVVDYNLYIRPDGNPQISWTSSSSYAVNFTSLASFSQATGLEQHSLISNSLSMVLSPST